jgi:thiol-disulfide isomerase/thioredoxin
MSVHIDGSSREIRNRFPQFSRFLIVGLLALSAVTNVLLVFKVRQLRGTVSALKAEDATTTGMHLPPLTAQDLSGQIVTVRFDETDRPTLLYVFTPGCGWCKKNEDNLRALASQTADRVRVVGLSLSDQGLKEYVEQKLPTVRVVNPDARTIAAYKLNGTPETILVSSQGIVLRVWKGAYADSMQREVEEYFRVKLPGLRRTS